MILLLDLSVTRDAVAWLRPSEILDIVMRAPGEEGCRGWHNQIIQNPNPRPEDRFELHIGRYHARVPLTCRAEASMHSFG